MFVEYHISILGKKRQKNGYIRISSVFKKNETMGLAAFISVYQRTWHPQTETSKKGKKCRK